MSKDACERFLIVFCLFWVGVIVAALGMVLAVWLIQVVGSFHSVAILAIGAAVFLGFLAAWRG